MDVYIGTSQPMDSTYIFQKFVCIVISHDIPYPKIAADLIFFMCIIIDPYPQCGVEN